MNRRSFIKRMGALLAISYVAPLSLSHTPYVDVIMPFNTKSYYLGRGELYFTKFPVEEVEEGIKIAAKELADKIDEDVYYELASVKFKNKEK